MRNNEQRVNIDGQTIIIESLPDDGTIPGGLLAQMSNIEEFQRDDFPVVPELGVTLGYQLTSSLRLLLGHSFIYWSRVARPGDQIVLDLNKDFLPSAFEPFTGPLRPEFVFRDTDF